MKGSLLLTICMDDTQQNPEGTVDDYFSLAKQWLYPGVIFNLFFQLVLKMGNYMNKGNTRIGSAAAFKIEYLNKVRWNSHNLLSLCFLLFISSFSSQDFANSVENVNSTISRFVAWLQPVITCAYSSYSKQLSNTKTSDNKSTLLHFLVQTIESKCPEVLNIKDEIPSVATAGKGRNAFMKSF